jgi:hypothetical protein
MGYYLPARSYLKPKQKNAFRTRLIFVTSALTIIAGVVIFTTIQLMDNYGASAKNVRKNAEDFSSVGSERFIPLIENTGNMDFPAQLAFFIVEANQYTVDVKWATVSEYKNAYFILERSYNNSDFKEIARVEGHGTTKESNDYSYTDDSLNSQIAFYRLKQVSESGESSFIGLEKGENPSVQKENELYIENVGPQPFDKGFNINYFSEIEGGVSVELIDPSGTKVFKAYATANHGYNTCHFPNGDALKEDYYTLRIANSNAVYTTRIRKKGV